MLFTSKSLRTVKCGFGQRKNDDVQPLYRDPWFTFRFADDRIIPRLHLEGVLPGLHISVIKINAETGGRLGLLATASVGEGGWVDLPQPIIMKAGEGFIAVPTTHQLTLTILPGTYAVCRLDADAALPPWATSSNFFSIFRTAEELCLVCLQSLVPDGVRCERDWRCLQLAGPIPFSTVGVLASLVQPLAEAGISVFAVSTFDTDYLLVKSRGPGPSYRRMGAVRPYRPVKNQVAGFFRSRKCQAAMSVPRSQIQGQYPPCILAMLLPIYYQKRHKFLVLFGLRRFRKAGELGFEPRQTDPESVVLPLHYSPKSGTSRCLRQFVFRNFTRLTLG
jgi:uncharacterized protein